MSYVQIMSVMCVVLLLLRMFKSYLYRWAKSFRYFRFSSSGHKVASLIGHLCDYQNIFGFLDYHVQVNKVDFLNSKSTKNAKITIQ